jgi:methylated-DNA-[protein]-cysteine S-methyltransferase
VKLEVGELDTPLGPLRFARAAGRVLGLAFADGFAGVERALVRRLGALELEPIPDGARDDTRARLAAFFAGELTALDGIAIELVGSEFQRRVWCALRALPPGTTTSYGALARALGRPAAARAVGAANGANPIWLVVPCHRALGANGALTGYGGGIERKRWLLAHEAKHASG